MELGIVVSHYFIHGTGEGMIPTIPNQRLVSILSLEMLSESLWAREEKDGNMVTLFWIYFLDRWVFNLPSRTAQFRDSLRMEP